MTPTLNDGDRVIVRRRRNRTCSKGDVIVFRTPKTVMVDEEASLSPPWRVKRVLAIGGDPVPDWMRESEHDCDDELVPPGFLVVHGDNPRSEDSRHLGYIDVRSVIAIIDRLSSTQ